MEGPLSYRAPRPRMAGPQLRRNWTSSFGTRPRGYPKLPPRANSPLPPQELKPILPPNYRDYLSKSDVVSGVDLAALPTTTRRSGMEICRSGYSRSFAGVLPERYEDVEVVVTNDYWECEKWSEMVGRERGRLLGVRLHHYLLPAPPPLPPIKSRAKRKYRKENRPGAPPPLNPGGPLRLREGGSMIASMTLATERFVLLMQLRQMKLIGPEMRTLLENPFVRKGGPYLTEMRKVLRQDGVQLIGGDDVVKIFLKKYPRFREREQMKSIIQKAGFPTFLHSITGVELVDDADVVPPHLWAEAQLPQEQVLISARQAWSSWAFLKIMEETHPSVLPNMRGIAPSFV